MTPHASLPGLTVVAHPLVRHKVALLRDTATPKKLFAELAEELAMLLAYEATSDLPLERGTVETPLESAPAERLPQEAVTLVPILRAGLGMVPGVLRLVPTARVGHIGLFRDHDSLEPVEYYCKIPTGAERGQVFLLDPMLATGGSAVNAATALKQRGNRDDRCAARVCGAAAGSHPRPLVSFHVSRYRSPRDRDLETLIAAITRC